MCKIATLIADLFEDAEYLQTAREFRKAGHQVDTVGLAGDKKVTGLSSQTVLIDKNVDKVHSRNYEALFIPGGFSPDKLRGNEEIINLVREFMTGEKPVFVVCNGVQLLISARMLAGRKVAGRKSLAQDIANAGGVLSGTKVTIDGNLISCSSDEEMTTFIIACLQRLSTEH